MEALTGSLSLPSAAGSLDNLCEFSGGGAACPTPPSGISRNGIAYIVGGIGAAIATVFGALLAAGVLMAAIAIPIICAMAAAAVAGIGCAIALPRNESVAETQPQAQAAAEAQPEAQAAGEDAAPLETIELESAVELDDGHGVEPNADAPAPNAIANGGSAPQLRRVKALSKSDREAVEIIHYHGTINGSGFRSHIHYLKDDRGRPLRTSSNLCNLPKLFPNLREIKVRTQETLDRVTHDLGSARTLRGISLRVAMAD
ncbi:MAG: hypothetical protein LBI39_04270 [Puniceicoccales bacterium]|jgi:hypothetical protein|nr:hypothetical protein [Puniceicoccales bacterium]